MARVEKMEWVGEPQSARVSRRDFLLRAAAMATAPINGVSFYVIMTYRSASRPFWERR